MKNNIKIKRIILIVLIITSIINIGKLVSDINKKQIIDVKNKKKYEAIICVDETEKIMRFKFVTVETDYWKCLMLENIDKAN